MTNSNAKDHLEGESLFHDPWLKPQGTNLQSLTETIAQSIEQRTTGRKRMDAVVRRQMVVGNILANLSLLVLSPNYRKFRHLAIATAKTKPTRYERKDFPKNLIAQTLQDLEALGLIHVHRYKIRQRLTTIEPTQDFKTKLQAARRSHRFASPAHSALVWNGRRRRLHVHRKPHPDCFAPKVG